MRMTRRVPMLMNRCCGVVVVLAVVFAPLLLGAVGESYIGTDFDDDVPMLNLDGELYDIRPRERRLANALVWCIAKPNQTESALQAALDWVCGPLPNQGQVNCGPVQSGGTCFNPDTVQNHASWAFNSYFQTHNATNQACEFQGAAIQTSVDPSTPTCVFQGANITVNGTITNNGTIVPSPFGAPTGLPNAAPTAVFVPCHLLHVSTVVILMTYLLTGEVF